MKDDTRKTTYEVRMHRDHSWLVAEVYSDARGKVIGFEEVSETCDDYILACKWRDQIVKTGYYIRGTGAPRLRKKKRSLLWKTFC
jgi:hypothetical protein